MAAVLTAEAVWIIVFLAEEVAFFITVLKFEAALFIAWRGREIFDEVSSSEEEAAALDDSAF